MTSPLRRQIRNKEDLSDKKTLNQTLEKDKRTGKTTDRSNLSALSSKCVSQICTCGLHKCPKIQEIPFRATTTNQELYRPYKINTKLDGEQDIKSYKSKPNRHYDPKSLETTYGAEFTQKKAKINLSNENQQIFYQQPKRKINTQTQYNTNYLKSKIRTEPQEQQRLSYTPKKTAKFNGQTEYQKQFYQKPQNNLNNALNDSYEYKPAKQHRVFNATTTYGEQYRPYKINTQRQDQSVLHHPNKVAFNATTQYDNVYKKYPKTSYQQQTQCLVDELPPYPNKIPCGQNHIKYSYKKNAWK